MLERFPQIQKLSEAEKLLLAQELYAEAFPPQTPEEEAATIALLEKRWADYVAGKDTAAPWEEVRARLQQRIRDRRKVAV